MLGARNFLSWRSAFARTILSGLNTRVGTAGGRKILALGLLTMLVVPNIIFSQRRTADVPTSSAVDAQQNAADPGEESKEGVPSFVPKTDEPSSIGDPCSWTLETVSPIPILDQGLTAVGGNLYSFSGVSNGALVATSNRFDGTAWSAITPLPAALEYPVAVSDGTSAYIVGGTLGAAGTANTIYRYNPGTNDYTTLAASNPATSTWNHAAVYVNGKIYKIGGYNGAGGVTTSLNTVEIYDVASNTWSAGAPYPLAQGWISAFTDGTFVYAAGGLSSVVGSVPSAKTYRYDPVANTWDDAAIADLPLSRWGASSSNVVYNGGWVLAGGYVNGAAAANISATVIKWDPTANTWGTLPDLVNGARSRTPGAVFNGAMHVVGGRSVASSGFIGTNTNHRLFCIDPNQPFITAGVTYVSDNGTPSNGTPDPGETATVSLALENIGGVATGNVVATLLATGGITNPSGPESYGVIAVDQTVARNFTFQVPGGATCGGEVTLTFDIVDGTTHYTETQTYRLGTITTAPVSFSNTTQVDLPGGQPATTAGPSAPYPSNITVAGLSGPRAVKVTFTGYRHEWYNDVDLLLVGPGGQKFIFNSDNGPGATELLPPITYSVADSGATLLPDAAFPMADGVTYRPSNIGANDLFDAPAPPAPYENAAPGGTATFASVFGTDGAAMNGVWSLYGDDDASGDFGFVSGGWTLTFDSLQYTCTTVETGGSARGDFDDDGRTDIAVWRPSDGNWHISRSTDGYVSYSWGASGDQITPGDYDNDGNADVAVYRQSTGTWFILNSATSTYSTYTWGGGSDVAVAGDYDDDGMTDVAVRRPSTGEYFILKSSGGTQTSTWGNATDTPVVGDFDGDGQTDLAVWRSSTGEWFINRSTDGTVTVTWGAAGDRVVHADYDGDGKDDVAVWRGSTGTWFILNSNGGTSTYTWGAAGDVPVPGNYDGDARDDIGVFRNGVWHIDRTTGGYLTASWGIGTDIAVPAEYIP